ncbi:MAG: hypothetical protein IJL54_00640 [Prevotella sp.]|nr:hypothetical protein [Prevotella sp.]
MNNLSRKSWYQTLLIAMIMMTPSVASAGDMKDYADPYNIFSWYSSGQGVIHITTMQDQRNSSGNTAASFHHGRIELEDPDTKKRIKIIVCEEYTKNGTSYLANPLFEDENHPATLYCTNDANTAYVLLNKSNRSTTFKVPYGNTVYAEYDWYYPACFAGKTMDVYAVGDIYTSDDGKDHPINAKCGTIDFPSVELTAYSLNISNDKEFKGYLQLPFSAVRPINNIHAEYYTDSQKKNAIKLEEQVFTNEKTMNGILKIPATVPHYSMKLCANINVSKWTPYVRGTGDPGKYDGDFVTPYSNTFDENQTSNAPMIHPPVDFRAENKAQGKVELSWKIDYVKYPDLFDGDMFQIQRSLTGKEEDFVDIGAELFDSNKQSYSFTDEDLISSLVEADIDPSTGGPHVKYRIRRSCTQMWDWEDNPAADSTECSFRQTLLLQPINAKASWESEELRTVNVEWEYTKDDEYTYYVWDDRAEMLLIMKMTNNKGEMVDSIARKITDAERQNHKMTISLPRSCVNYTMQIKVNKNDSPISCGFFMKVLESTNLSAEKVLDNRLDTYWEETYEYGTNAFVVFSTHDPIQFPSGSTIRLYNPDDAETYGSYFPNHVEFFCSNIYNGNFKREIQMPFTHWKTLVNLNVGYLPTHNGEYVTLRRSTVNDDFHKYFCLRLSAANQKIRIAKLEIVGPDGSIVKGSAIVDDYIADVQIPEKNGNFYYNNSGKIDVYSLEWTPLQSSILLEWKMEDPTQTVDRFEILRWETGTRDTTIVDSNVTQMQFEDKKVSPTRTYYYIVRALTSCEELTYTQTLPNDSAAHCIQTCKVEGYVRFADGTGIPAINVSVTGEGLTSARQVNTDDNGHYMVDGLPYNKDNGQSALYHVSVNGIESDKLSPECQKGLDVTFNDRTNLQKGFSFTVTSGYKFTAKVMYNGTSIPVKDARIRYCYNKDVTKGHKVADDEWHEARTSAGAIMTDFEGNFSMYVIGGPMSFQVYKPDHTFYQDGYYYNDFTQNKSGIYFFDDTKVKLIGRVTGGKVQGDLPLGNSLSTNNLGDSLQIMMTLEGDNTSYLVFENNQRSLSERDTVFTHKSHDDKYTYQTRMHTTRHNIQIWPDVQTGEYEVMLPPVKWKIQRISAQGYPTLFQDGKVSEVIDLTDSLTLHQDTEQGSWIARNGKKVEEVTLEYNAIYNRIYQAPITLDYKQVGYDKFDYLGDRTYMATDLAGNKITVPLAYQTKKPNWSSSSQDSMEVHYTFGYPVFNLDRSYPVKISVGEKYYYNNDPNSDIVDIVAVSGIPVTVRNGLAQKGTFNTALYDTTDSLDENGEAIYILQAAQQPTIATGEQAIRTVEFSIKLDGVTYVAAPLRAYVLDQYYKTGAQNYMSINHPVLVDILRDPPGGGSSAKLSKGSTLKLSYQMDMAWKAGSSINFSVGSGMNSFIGTVVGPMGLMAQTGVINQAKTDFNTSIDLIFSGSGQRAFTYTMTASEDITTDGGETMKGADADVYMGVETNLFVRPAVAVRAIPDFMFKKLGGQLKAGRLVEIAKGEIGDSTYHLVRDEVLSYGQKLVSNFAHSQKYILNQLVPGLAKQCQSLMFTGTYGEAKKQANVSGKRVYLSLRSNASDEKFGMLNVDKDGNYIYNSDGQNGKNYTTMDGDYNYLIVLPDKDDDTNTNDDVLNFGESMYHWLNMIARNEKEKLEATDLVEHFEFDGGTTKTYSEEFTADYTTMNSYNWMGTSTTHDYFDQGPDGSVSSGMGVVAFLGPTIAKTLELVINSTVGKQLSADNVEMGAVLPNQNLQECKLEFVGTRLGIGFTPVLNYGLTPKQSEYNKYSRKESFTLKIDKNSNLIVDVYRTNLESSRDSLSKYYNGYDTSGIFMENDFLNTVDNVKYFLERGVGHVNLAKDNWKSPTSFVYRTRGGATLRPWEDERKTVVYQPGTVLDVRTTRIEKPVIKFEQPTITGVPHDQPARFKVTFINESEKPSATKEDFLLYLVDGSNPHGAKIYLNGEPLMGENDIIRILKPTLKTEAILEVYRGEGFDFENLKIGIRVPSDLNNSFEAEFSAHFIPIAGDIAITVPGDKWIMNTDAQQDKRGYYMPVVISGFNKTQPNFDHIELQYKEANRGDDYWTNLCSYYADSTYYKTASGTREMIPENGYINAKFYGEGNVIEKSYDLRAVIYCRNGNNFITNASKVLNGIKDTRRPMLFGTPEPKDGILGAGDNIVFNFSENIEHNYLNDVNNFEVLGETNELNVQEQTALLFKGESYAETEAKRNFADKNITIDLMIKPTDTDVPLFSHGVDGNKLQLWLTDKWKLLAIVNNVTYESKKEIFKDGFQHVALILNNEDKTLKLYNDSIIGTFTDVVYKGYGPLIFGATNEINPAHRKHYQGRMMEARVWYRDMESHLNTYGKQLLTGYEMGLVDYYPMNEGKGNYINDKAQGARAQLYGASWALPQGMSLKLDKTEDKEIKGLQINSRYMSRTSEDDYTLMFWFNTDNNGRGALISNGAGKTTDALASEKFFIGFEGKDLKYRTNGMEIKLGEWSDGSWHHYAMTVNRSHKVANIYIDNELRASFATDTLGGMSGDDFYIGNMVWKNAGDLKLYQQNALTGYIDEICLFKQALPPTLIEHYGKKSPSGNEKGLITYLNFNRQEWQKNGDYVLRPFALNQVVKKDMDGKPTEDRDTVFVENVSYIMSHIDQNIGAPVQPNLNLKKLNFSFVGKDNQLLVNIDEQNSRINKRNLYVTVMDIPDLNGNYMSSPATVEYYVDRNKLLWETKNVQQKFYDYGSTYTRNETFTVDILNNSGSTHVYTIEGLPRWLTVDKKSNVIEPLDEQTLTFTVDVNINVGEYDEIIYLTDEDGLSEPLSVLVNKIGQTPYWYVEDSLKSISMNIVARVKIDDAIVTDPEDIVAAFDNTGRCMGKANIDYNAETGQSLLFLTVFNNEDEKKPLIFKLWHRQTGKTLILQADPSIQFTASGIVGSITEPVIMTAGKLYAQTLSLVPGWNWISFNVYNEMFEYDVNELLSQYEWNQGDILTDDTHNITLVYNKKMKKWLNNDDDKVYISNARSYKLFVHKYTNLEITGYILDQRQDRTIEVDNNWNNIGYTPLINLPVSTALTEYNNIANEGDLIKCRELFAMYTKSNGSSYWMGTLKYMRPGEGYMLHRNGGGKGSFTYPFYESGSTYFETSLKARSRAPQYASTMSMVAVADGIELEEDDKLIALCDGEIRGEAISIDSVFYMSIAGDQKAPLSFVVEHDGEIIAATGEIIPYQVNGISGSPNEPTHINFVRNEIPQQGWYTVQGYKLNGKPSRRGVYIYNGKKQVIK